MPENQSEVAKLRAEIESVCFSIESRIARVSTKSISQYHQQSVQKP